MPSLRFLSRIGSLTSNSHGYSPEVDSSSVAEAGGASDKYSRTGPCAAHDRRHTGEGTPCYLLRELNLWTDRRCRRIAVCFAHESHDDYQRLEEADQCVLTRGDAP